MLGVCLRSVCGSPALVCRCMFCVCVSLGVASQAVSRCPGSEHRAIVAWRGPMARRRLRQHLRVRCTTHSSRSLFPAGRETLCLRGRRWRCLFHIYTFSSSSMSSLCVLMICCTIYPVASGYVQVMITFWVVSGARCRNRLGEGVVGASSFSKRRIF